MYQSFNVRITVLIFTLVPILTFANHFSFEMIKEGGKGGWEIVEGKPTGHEHALITCENVGVFVLRTRKECLRLGNSLECAYEKVYFPNIQERAKLIVQRLNDAVEVWEHTKPGAELHKDDPHEMIFETRELSDGIGILLIPSHGADAQLIAVATKGDKIGYERRSPHPNVTKHLVAEWWLALIHDIFSVLVLHESPLVLIKTDQGQILMEIAHRVELVEHETDSDENEEDHPFNLEFLSQEERDDLRLLPFKIPVDFNEEWLKELPIPDEHEEIHDEHEE